MRLRLRSFLLTSALTFAPAVASATTISGLYVDGGAGYNEVQDQHVHANSPADGPAAQKFTINHGTGYTGFGAIGYGFGNGLRVEAEGLYNSSEDEYTQNVGENEAETEGIRIQGLDYKFDPNGYGKNKVVEVIPFNYDHSAKEIDQSSDGHELCSDNYSWCALLGGAPVIVIQKIDELPDWASPQRISNNIPGTNPYTNWTGSDTADPPLLPSLVQKIATPLPSPETWEHGIVPYTSQETEQHFVDCNDCYYISVLTPQQAQTLYNGGGFPNNTPPISNEMMPNGSNTGLSGKEIPVEFPQGATDYGSSGMLLPFGALETKGLLPKGIYYLQGAMGPEKEQIVHNDCSFSNYTCIPGTIGTAPGDSMIGDVDGNEGQIYYDAPNQKKLDEEINKLDGLAGDPEFHSASIPYRYINPNNPGTNGFPEVTPLPTCTNGRCSLNITPEWKTQGWNPQPVGFGPDAGGMLWPYSGIGVMKTTIRSPYVHQVQPLTLRSVSYHGRDQSYGGFANVLYDFDLERLFGLRSIVTPFVGGGAGYLWQRYDDMGPVAAASITGVHGGFAWQGIAGVAFDTGISGLQITAQYRMIGQPGSFYNGAFNYGTEGGHANFDQRFNHQFIVGFRYAFHNRPVHIAPPSVSRAFATAAAAAPAPVPARSYLVFFDWNQYALTSRARQMVVEAAHATSYVHTTRINVNGYTDSSAAPGPAGQKYNYALSVKRARSVEAELIRNGVPASEIVIRGYGDANPLVPTGPNTREPQNRRVEIILHA